MDQLPIAEQLLAIIGESWHAKTCALYKRRTQNAIDGDKHPICH